MPRSIASAMRCPKRPQRRATSSVAGCATDRPRRDGPSSKRTDAGTALIHRPILASSVQGTTRRRMTLGAVAGPLLLRAAGMITATGRLANESNRAHDAITRPTFVDDAEQVWNHKKSGKSLSEIAS